MTSGYVARFVTCLSIGALQLRAADVRIAGSDLHVKSEGIEATGSFRTRAVTLTVDGVQVSGNGNLIVTRGDGTVSDMLEGGAIRQVALGDTLAVVVSMGNRRMLAALTGEGTVATMPLRTIGLPCGVSAAYDLTHDQFIGPVVSRLAFPLDVGKATVVSLVGTDGSPVVVATSDMLNRTESTQALWDGEKKTLSGSVALEAGADYDIRVLAPSEPARWIVASSDVSGGSAAHRQDGPWVRLTLKCAQSGTAVWRLFFEKEAPGRPAAAPVAFSATAPTPRCVMLSSDRHGVNILLRRNDGAELPMDGQTASDTNVHPATRYTYTLCAVDWSGETRTLATTTIQTPARAPLPPLPNVYLSELAPVRVSNGWNGEPRRDKSIEDNPIHIDGERYEKGMGVHAPAELIYAVKPGYKRFVAVVGVDDETGSSGSVRFAVLVDGCQVMRTPVLTQDDEGFGVDLNIPDGAKELRLVVDDGDDGVGCDHADWANAGFVTGK